MKFENGDEVVQDGCYVTVRVGDIKATRRYLDSWQARRAVSKLEKSPEARVNFFRRIRVKK
jgi:hypothetical protein